MCAGGAKILLTCEDWPSKITNLPSVTSSDDQGAFANWRANSAFTYGFGEPCLPTRATVAPTGPQWVHEIKHDGYRLMVRKTPAGLRIRARRGYDWTTRFRLIAEATACLPATSFVLDGEGVILRSDGVSDFEALRSRRHDHEVQLLAFDLLELDGADLRRERLDQRKAKLTHLLRHHQVGIQIVEHIEHPGDVAFARACRLGLEGVVSKRRDAAYRQGRSRIWLKVKNPQSPAARREALEDWDR
jgi:bifunctional non-homologous end joining protein LigD